MSPHTKRFQTRLIGAFLKELIGYMEFEELVLFEEFASYPVARLWSCKFGWLRECRTS